MKSIVIALIISIAMIANTSLKAQNTKWNGKQFAVALTYDDGLNVHLDNAIPALDKYGFRGTFYIPGKSTIMTRMDEWRKAAEEGHELGNHTLFHPCNGQSKGREWVSKEYDLDSYTLSQIKDEILVANTLLHAVDGKTERTFAYTCGDYEAENTSFKDFIGENFVGARDVIPEFNYLDSTDLTSIHCFPVDGGETASQLIDIVNRGMKEGALVVFLFHGVGGEHSLNVELNVHNELLQYLNSIEDKVWVAPLVEIANYIKSNQTN